MFSDQLRATGETIHGATRASEVGVPFQRQLTPSVTYLQSPQFRSEALAADCGFASFRSALTRLSEPLRFFREVLPNVVRGPAVFFFSGLFLF